MKRKYCTIVCAQRHAHAPPEWRAHPRRRAAAAPHATPSLGAMRTAAVGYPAARATGTAPPLCSPSRCQRSHLQARRSVCTRCPCLYSRNGGKAHSPVVSCSVLPPLLRASRIARPPLFVREHVPAMNTVPLAVTATPRGALNTAVRASPSPPPPGTPTPASVSTTPVARSTRRRRWLPVSATNSVPVLPPPLASCCPDADWLPGGAYANAVGALNRAPPATPSDTPATPAPARDRVDAGVRGTAVSWQLTLCCTQTRTCNRASRLTRYAAQICQQQAYHAQPCCASASRRPAATVLPPHEVSAHHSVCSPAAGRMPSPPHISRHGTAIRRHGVGGRAPLCLFRFRFGKCSLASPRKSLSACLWAPCRAPRSRTWPLARRPRPAALDPAAGRCPAFLCGQTPRRTGTPTRATSPARAASWARR